MRGFALAVLLAAALPAHAQLYKCVDAKGRTHYTDKPLADCRTAPAKALSAPPAPPSRKEAVSKPGSRAPAPGQTKVAQRVPTAEERARFASDCKVLREQLEWLRSPRGAEAPNHAARLGQVQAALRPCP